MKEKKNFFREALQKYYKPSFTRKKEATEPNFGDKVNDCIISVLKGGDAEFPVPRGLKPVQPNKEIIVLPTGCYTKMLESDDLSIYTKCLLQFGDLSKQQIELIKRCVRGGRIRSCDLSPSVEFESAGGYRYTDCCGQVINDVTDKTGFVEINACITRDTIESYSDGKTRGAKIKSIKYSDKPCLCEKVKQ